MSSFPYFLIILVSLAELGNCETEIFRCYQCIGPEDQCTTKKAQIVDCPRKTCLKSVTERGHVQVTRACAPKAYHQDECGITELEGAEIEVCLCKTSLCNSAQKRVTDNARMMAFPILALVVIMENRP